MAIDTYVPERGAERPPSPKREPSLPRILLGIVGIEINRMRKDPQEAREVIVGAPMVAFLIAQEAVRRSVQKGS